MRQTEIEHREIHPLLTSVGANWVRHRFKAGAMVAVATVLFVVFAGLAILMRLTRNYLRGSSNEWQQGDWLIHRDLVEIRRGHIGSWLLDLADFFSASPLTVVFVLQAVLVVVLFYLLIRLFLLTGQPLILAPFVFSPTVFVIFWLPWDYGALRKETLAFIALFVILLACLKTSPLRLVSGAVLLALSVYGHEANTLFLPVFLGVLWLCRETVPRGIALWASLILVVGATLHAFSYAMTHRQLEDIALVCQPLLERGLPAEFCDGAIFWLTQDTGDAQAYMSSLYGPQALVLLAGVYALTVIPLVIVLNHLENHRLMVVLALLAALPFVPLFFVAVDWTRWIGMQVFCMMILTMAALKSGRTQVRRPPALGVVAGIMGVSLLWVPNVTMVFVEWVWVRKTFADIAGILS